MILLEYACDVKYNEIIVETIDKQRIDINNLEDYLMKKSKSNAVFYLFGSGNGQPEEFCSGWSLLVFCAALFLLVVFTAQETVSMLCVLLGFGVLLTAVIQRKRPMAGRLHVLFLLVTLYVLWMGIACFRSPYPVLSLKEFGKILAGFLFFLLIVLTAGRGKSAGRNAAAAVSTVAAVFSFLSIDLVSTRWFSGAFRGMVEVFTNDYSVNSGLEVGTRINSILAEANTFAGVTGLGVLLALGLALSCRGKERALHVVCLYISALGFVLAFSLGAMGFICVSFLLFLLATPKGEKLPAAVLMIEALLLTMAGVVAVYVSVFDGTSQFSLIPLLATVAGAALLVVLDKAISRKVCDFLSTHRVIPLIALAALVCCAVGYAVLAFHLTGPAALSPNETLNRAVNLSAGNYTLSATGSEDTAVAITCQNETDLIIHTSTTLYSGPANGAVFTVPEGTRAVWFALSSPQGGTLENVTYTGAESGALKLNYKLLPGFMANRLQGLWANENSVQRTEFWQDGLRIWQKSPVVGEGLGAVEAELYSVARFEYQSRYVHNHYVQTLADAGVIGLVLFVGVLTAALWTAWNGRKRGAPLAPALFAGLAFAALQGINQAVFSLHSFLSLIFCLYAVVDVHCSEQPVETAGMAVAEKNAAAKTPEHPVGAKTQLFSKSLIWCTVLLCVIWSGLLLNNLRAQNDVMVGTGYMFDRLENAIHSDPFSKYDSIQAYIYYSGQVDDEAIQNQAGLYAAEYTRPGNTDPDYLAEFFFKNHALSSAFDSLSRHVAFNRARTAAWQYAFTLLAKQDDGSAEFHQLAQGIAAQLTEANNNYLLQPIALYGRAQAYYEALA